jgi:hypothetical protein
MQINGASCPFSKEELYKDQQLAFNHTFQSTCLVISK